MGGMTFLPFVRESKIAVPVAGEKKPAAAPASAPAPVAAAAAPAPAAVAEVTKALSEANISEDPLEAAIVAKGNELRDAKAAKVNLAMTEKLYYRNYQYNRDYSLIYRIQK